MLNHMTYKTHAVIPGNPYVDLFETRAGIYLIWQTSFYDRLSHVSYLWQNKNA